MSGLSANRGPATFSIGPLCWTADAGVLEKFVREAQFGARFVFAKGPVPPRSSAVWMLATEYQRAGLVHLFQPKGDQGRDFIVERSSAVVALGRGAATAVPVGDPNSPMARLRGAVSRAADAGRPLQTNATLATLCDFKDANAVKYRLRQILNEGVFRLIDNGPNAARGVERVKP